VILRASGTTQSGGTRQSLARPRREAASEMLLTDENAAGGSVGRGGGVGANTAAASPAVLLPGALCSPLATRPGCAAKGAR
jgi:hypothetical protein